MTRRPNLRRFPHEVVRRRQGPATRDQFGELEPGPVVEAVLPADVQPVGLEDKETVGGDLLSERLTVFVPVGIERRVSGGDTLRWHGEALMWNGEPLRWGGGVTGYLVGDVNPLLAAFEDRGADQVEYASAIFVVEESRLWPGSHSRAVLLRES